MDLNQTIVGLCLFVFLIALPSVIADTVYNVKYTFNVIKGWLIKVKRFIVG